MAGKYDLVVLGGGSGGVRAARLAASGGAKTALLEDRLLGGTCVNVGCVPKKLFSFSAHYGEDFRDAAGFGWSGIGGPRFDFGALRDAKDREIARLNGVYRGLLESSGVEVIDARGTLDAEGRVLAGDRVLESDRILVATGSRPSRPPIEGIEHAITSDDIFHLGELPSSALVLGGGYIAIEFACILAGWGVESSLLHRGPRVLTRFDGEIARFVQAEAAKKGVRFLLEDQAARIARSDSGALAVELKGGDTLEAGLVLCALGRAPNSGGIGLEDAGVEIGRGGAVVVDDRFRTSREGVFAIGDVIGRVALTPVAIAEAKNFVAREFGGEDAPMDYGAIATAVFCSPNIGTVGLTEEDAEKQGIDCEILRSEFRHMRHALSGSEERTLMKAVVGRDGGKVLGMHMVGADAGEIIQGFAAAIKCGLTKERLHATVGIHPTAAEEFVTL